jgi:hypothetical protein
MIDGVFVPSPEGKQVKLDGADHRFDFPPNLGVAYGSLWARRTESALETNRDATIDFWGGRTLPGIIERLKQLRHGLLAMHSNVGITFDLRTMQMIHRRSPNEFRAAVGNLENSHVWKPEEISNVKRTADFYLFVDGRLRFERLGFRREDGEQNITVPLSPRDRFLTLVVTDDGNLEFDHVMLIDPVIALHDESNNSQPR